MFKSPRTLVTAAYKTALFHLCTNSNLYNPASIELFPLRASGPLHQPAPGVPNHDALCIKPQFCPDHVPFVRQNDLHDADARSSFCNWEIGDSDLDSNERSDGVLENNTLDKITPDEGFQSSASVLGERQREIKRVNAQAPDSLF